MQRSSSTSRASDEFLVNFSPASIISLPMKLTTFDGLPLYDPNSDATKKELGLRKSSGENVVHIIPLAYYMEM
ncbi:Transmembrane protein [Parasponia andersonii]|uniref:Transmembrane protein n=1 Tax=Parasponia andersonii TaxID=3476 RepID=A0A2P5C7E5_PARAD|nr:Transmembrane protein [Parasponia andersonii]